MPLSFSSQITDESPTHVYYEAKVINNTNQNLPLVFNENRTDTIIEHPSEWELSIVRFEIPIPTIPIFFVTPTNNAFPNILDDYKVTIRDGGGTIVTQDLIWVTRSANAPPTPTNGVWPVNHPYYRCYNYIHWMTIVNTAIATAATGIGLTAAQTPIMTFDPVTRLFSIRFHSVFLSSSPTYFLSFNANLINFFLQFDFITNFNNLMADQYAEFVVTNLLDNMTSSGGNDYYTMTQSSPSLGPWNDFLLLEITSGNLPIVAELVTQNPNVNVSSTGQAILPKVTDFIPNLDGWIGTVIQYFPQSEYRMLNLYGSHPLKVINLNVFMRDTENNLIVVELVPGYEASIKIMFRRKGVTD